MKMNRKPNIVLALILMFSLLGLPTDQHVISAQNTTGNSSMLNGAVVFVEDTLRVAGGSVELSAIVSAKSSDAARQAVLSVGGIVTADLWVIDAVAARFSGSQLADLVQVPGVRSIVENKGLATSSEPVTPDGWVTNARTVVNEILLDGVQSSPVAFFPDGGFISVSENGKVMIANANGSVRARMSLQGSGYTAPVVTNANGIAYITGQNGWVHALNADGSVLWQFSAGSGMKFPGSVVLGEHGAVYAATDSRWMYALDANDGTMRWRFKAEGANPGVAGTTPVIAPDGTILFTSIGAGSETRGHLFALTPAGKLKWTFMADAGNQFSQSPLIGPNGVAYLASNAGTVYAVSSTGARLYRFNASAPVTAAPALAPDGTLFVPTAAKLFAVNSSGNQRFAFVSPTGGTFETMPVLSPQHDTVYIATAGTRRLEGEWVSMPMYALNTVNGAVRWSRYTDEAGLASAPVVAADGRVMMTNASGKLFYLEADGRVVFTQKVNGSITQSPGLATGMNAVIRSGTASLAVLGRLPTQYDGRRDVTPSSDKRHWKLTNPINVDIGVDQLHNLENPNGRKSIRGDGIGVAVVDTGVYFSDEAKFEMGARVSQLFVGQADFVGDGQCPVGTTTSTNGKGGGGGGGNQAAATQYPGYCFATYEASRDGNGHGSHVAGIIWSNFIELNSGTLHGVAPDARVLSVRVLDDAGYGTYADTIEGIQYVIQNKNTFNIRVMNLSLSAAPTVPYFVDPLNRAVERAWAAGIVVLAAAGNVGPHSETITVPGNDPYVITVGAVDSLRTPGYWTGDKLPSWSATGPTHDGFLKPDVLAPGAQIISYMFNDKNATDGVGASARLVLQHPDHSATSSLFRMSGTSMATSVASGVVALMLQVNPGLTPDQVKYRLLESALPAITQDAAPLYNIMQQGMGRIWAPTAVLGEFPAGATANQGMNIQTDLAAGYGNEAELAYHYQGPVQKILSDDGQTLLYYVADSNGTRFGLGAADGSSGQWLGYEALISRLPTWSGGNITMSQGMNWAGGVSLGAGLPTWSGRLPTWSGGLPTWSGRLPTWSGSFGSWTGGLPTWSGGLNWAGGLPTWSGGMALWSGRLPTWSGGMALWSGGMPLWSGGLSWAGGLPTWSGSLNGAGSIGSTVWIGDDWQPASPASRSVSQPLDVPETHTQRIFLPTVSGSR